MHDTRWRIVMKFKLESISLPGSVVGVSYSKREVHMRYRRHLGFAIRLPVRDCGSILRYSRLIFVRFTAGR